MHFAQSPETKASITKVYCSVCLDVLPLCCTAGVHVNKRKQWGTVSVGLGDMTVYTVQNDIRDSSVYISVLYIFF